MKKKHKKKIVKNNDMFEEIDDASDRIMKQVNIMLILISILFLIAASILCLLPGDIINNTIISNHTIIIHYIGFLLLFPLLFGLYFTSQHSNVFSKSIGTGILIAIMTEAIQWFIPGRHADPVDLLINLAGLFTIPIIVLMLSELVFRPTDGPL